MGKKRMIMEKGKPVWMVKAACWTSSLVILGIALLLAGCSHETAQAVVNLVPVQRKLEAEFGTSNVDFDRHDGTTLSVTLVDCPAKDLVWGQRAERAREIAESICESYASMESIDRVRVAFEAGQQGLVGNVSGSVAFSFDKRELECGDQ